MSEDLFRPIFAPDAFREAVVGSAWLGAMLRAEAALAVAEARAGLIPREAADAIVSCCDPNRFDPEEIGRAGRASGNPVPPLVKALTAAVSGVSEEAARHVQRARRARTSPTPPRCSFQGMRSTSSSPRWRASPRPARPSRPGTAGPSCPAGRSFSKRCP